ncbi:MAG: DoxX-like family protein [Pyrinomonadaceae bacterium]
MELGTILNVFIASVWIGFGLFCKVLGLVPRQQEIVARILGDAHARLLTKAIGIAEIFMAVWILSGFQSRLNAVVQIVIILTMNVIEFVRAPDLLLCGRANAFLAFLLVLLIYAKEFLL